MFRHKGSYLGQQFLFPCKQQTLPRPKRLNLPAICKRIVLRDGAVFDKRCAPDDTHGALIKALHPERGKPVVYSLHKSSRFFPVHGKGFEHTVCLRLVKDTAIQANHGQIHREPIEKLTG